MRSVILYQFSELTEKAKNNALNQLREECFERSTECDFADANATVRQVLEIAHVQCDIQSSSQGYYVRWYRDTDEQYDKTDEEVFEQFLKDFDKNFRVDSWSDTIMQTAVCDTKFDESRSYAGNISWLLADYYGMIERDMTDYFDDKRVERYIEDNDFEFTENGTLYHE